MTNSASNGDTREGSDWRGIVAAVTSISTVGIGLSLGLPLLALVLESRGVSATAIGINTAMAGVASIVAVPFVTPLARRVGTARLLWLLIAVAAVGFVGFYLVDALWAWFPLRFIFHGAITAIFVLSEFWISSCAPNDKRGYVLGVYATALSVGFAIGPLILSLVGWQGMTPFAVGFAIFAFSAVPVVLARSASPRIERKPAEPFARFLIAVPIATFAVFAFGAVESGAILPLLPVYGLRLGLSSETATLLVTATVLGNVAFQIPLGLMSDRMDRRLLLLACASTGVVGAGLIPLLAGNLAALFVNLFIWGGVTAGLYTVGLAHLAARYRDADLAAANAAFIMMYSFGMLVGPVLVGIGIDLWDPHGFAVVCAAFFGGYACLAAARLHRAHQS